MTRAARRSAEPRDPDLPAMWSITAAAALVRLAYGVLPRVVRWDEAGHLLVASNLAAGRGYSELTGTLDVHLPPVLPLASAALLKLGVAPEWATALIHIVTGALLCLPVFLLARALYGRRVAVIASLLIAAYPALAAAPYTWSTMTESPFLLFVFGGVWLVYKATLLPARIRASEPYASLPVYAALGALFGLAYLTRPEGLTYFAVLGLFMAGWHLVNRTLFRSAVLVRLGLTVAACLLVMSPYVAYLHRVTGHWLLSGKVGLILDIAPAYLADDQAAHDRAVARLDSSGEEIMWLSPDRFEKNLPDAIRADPPSFVAQVLENARRTGLALFAEDLFTPWAAALAALGLLTLPRRAKGRHGVGGELLLLATLLPLLSFWVFFVISRFLVGALPVGLIWAAVGLHGLMDWLGRGVHRLAPQAGRLAARPAFVLPLLLVLLLCWSQGWLGLRRDVASMPWTHQDAGEWLAANVAAEAVVMTRHSEVGLYAARPLVAAPAAEWDEIVRYGKTRGARYLVVDDWELRRLRPQLAMLADPASAPPEVKHVRTFSAAGRTTLIYEFVS